MPIRKQRLVWVFAFLCFIAGALIWLGRAHAASIGFSLSEDTSSGAPREIKVQVLDEWTRQVLEDAEVSITDFVNAKDQKLKAITIAKAGYSMISIIGIQSNRVVAYLQPLPTTQAPVVQKGTLEGWHDLPRPSDDVYAGIVYRSLSILDLLHFDKDAFISPLKDQIDVFGSRDVPSNLVLPDQEIPFFFTSIHLNKPDFRLPLVPGRETQLSALRVQMAADDVIEAVQSGKKVSIDILNKIHFTGVGQTETFMPQENVLKAVEAPIELKPFHKISVTRPPFEADVIVAAATDRTGDKETLVPTDVKVAINSKKPDEIRQITLVAPSEEEGKSKQVFSLAIGNHGKKISGIITDQAGRDVFPGEFLSVEELTEVKQLPELISVIAPPHGLGAVVFESETHSFPVWTVYALPAAGEIKVPTRQLSSNPTVKGYAITQLEFNQSFNEHSIDGNQVMRTLERFTRTGTKIQNFRLPSLSFLLPAGQSSFECK